MLLELVQSEIIFENKDKNLKLAENIIKSSNSDLILFPEMSFTGFSMSTNKIGETNLETLNIIKNLAFKYNKFIGFGWVKNTQTLSENHYSIVSNNGVLISDYTKIHPFSYANENKYYKKGENIPFVKIKDFTLTTFICYDLRFPEIFQYASKKSDLIIVAANWPNKRKEHWQTLLKARAIENLCYICGINAFGQIDNQYYSGNSMAINPDGKVLKSLSNKSGSIILNLKNDVNSFRKNFPTKLDRQDNFYKNLY